MATRFSRYAVFSSVLGLLGIAPATHATLIASDSFNSYSTGAINGDNSGSGWTGAYSSASSSVTVISGGLNYTAGSININGGTQAVQIADATNNDALLTRAFTSQSTNAPLWFSILYKAQAGLTVGDVENFWIGKNATIANSGSIGDNFTGSSAFGARADGMQSSAVSAGNTIDPTHTYLLVGRFSTDGTNAGAGSQSYDETQLWIDPTTLTEANLGAPSVLVDKNTAFSSGVAFFGVRTAGLTAGDKYLFDEFRVGTSYADVVPEPGAAAMTLALAAAGMTKRRRGRLNR